MQNKSYTLINGKSLKLGYYLTYKMDLNASRMQRKPKNPGFIAYGLIMLLCIVLCTLCNI